MYFAFYVVFFQGIDLKFYGVLWKDILQLQSTLTKIIKMHESMGLPVMHVETEIFCSDI
jgi:hypothetical protein